LIDEKKINKQILEAASIGVKDSMQMGMQGYPLQETKSYFAGN